MFNLTASSSIFLLSHLFPWKLNLLRIGIEQALRYQASIRRFFLPFATFGRRPCMFPPRNFDVSVERQVRHYKRNNGVQHWRLYLVSDVEVLYAKGTWGTGRGVGRVFPRKAIPSSLTLYNL